MFPAPVLPDDLVLPVLTAGEVDALVNALTRRRFFAAAALVAALGASGAAGQEATPVDGLGADGTWSFTDDTGATITLPAVPKRIVADPMTASALWEYGIKVGATWDPGRFKDTPYIEAISGFDPQGMEDVSGSGDQNWAPDLEKLVGFDPDLIIGVTYDAKRLYFVNQDDAGRLPQIAPVLAINNGFLAEGEAIPTAIPVHRIAELARALGAETETFDQQLSIRAWQAAEARLKAVATAKPEIRTVIGWWDTTGFWVHLRKGWGMVEYVADLGVNVVQVESDEVYSVEVSWELFPKYPADLILIGASMEGTDTSVTPIYEQLPAVKAGQVGYWMGNPPLTPRAMAFLLNLLADQIEAANVVA